MGSTLNDDDRKAWNEISNDINSGLGLDNNYVNAGNKLQEGKTTDAVVNMGVTAASNSGNQTLITVSKTVQAQNDYVNNVSSGMDQKTAQDAAARQISDALLDDMEARERIADEKRRQERIAAEKRNEYNSSGNMYTTSSSTTSNMQYSAPSNTQNSAPSRTESSASSNTQYSTPNKTTSKENVTNSSNSILKYKKEALDALSHRIEEVKQLLGKVSNKNQNEYSELQETLREMAIEYWEKNEEYKHLSSTGNTSYKNQYKLSISQDKYSNEQVELLTILGDMSIEYWEKNEEYKQLVANGSSGSILKYKKESVNSLSESIMEVRKLLK